MLTSRSCWACWPRGQYHQLFGAKRKCASARHFALKMPFSSPTELRPTLLGHRTRSYTHGTFYAICPMPKEQGKSTGTKAAMLVKLTSGFDQTVDCTLSCRPVYFIWNDDNKCMLWIVNQVIILVVNLTVHLPVLDGKMLTQLDK